MLSSLSLALWLAAVPEVALLSTGPTADVSELRFQPVGDSALAPVVARLPHLAGEDVHAALIPGTRQVVAVAVTEPVKELSFASSLFLLEAGKPPRLLADRIAVATRPLVTADGRIFVQRGRPGEQRVDALTVDEIDLRSGRAREVLAFSGFTAFLAGSVGRELLVYRVGPKGADLVAVHADALGVRVLIPHFAPLARDFVVTADGRALLYTEGDSATGRWFVERLDLATLARTRLVEGDSMALLPTPFPDGRVGYSPAAGSGLKTVEGQPLLPSHGPGYERVRAFTRKGVALGLHERPGEFPTAFGGFAVPAAHRLELAGVVP